MNLGYGDFEMKEIQRLEGHTGKVLGIDLKRNTRVSGSSLVIVSWSDDKTVRIWEQDLSGSFQCKAVLEESHAWTVRSCVWSSPSKLLAAACSDATTAIWKNVGVAYERVFTLKGHDNEVRNVSWNREGDLLATCGGDTSIWIWEVLPGNEFDCASMLQGHTQDVTIIKWHPMSNVLLSCSYDNTIKVWDVMMGRDDWSCIQTLGESDSGHTSTVCSLSFNKYGEKMVTCSDDLTIKIWRSQTNWMNNTNIWSHVCTLSGYHDRTIFSVDWFRQECLGYEFPAIIASVGDDDTIRLFFADNDSDEDDKITFKLVLKKEKAHEMNVNSVKWSGGDRILLASASDDGTVKIWEVVCPRAAGSIAS